MFEFRGLNWYELEYGGTEVAGQLIYTGGGTCLGYVEISGTFFGADGRVVGTGLANFNTLPSGSGVPFTVNLTESVEVHRAELLLTEASRDA